MKTLKTIAAAALLVASQAHAATAAPTTSGIAKFAPSGITATPGTEPRSMSFKLPLIGDTKSCVINISYGDKPGVGPQNDGDTHLNGQASLDRVRTYSADGTYVFTAHAVSGCTGDARVSFTIGKPASPVARPAGVREAVPGVALQQATPVMASAAKPAVVSAAFPLPLITGIAMPETSVLSGGVVEVLVNGTGYFSPNAPQDYHQCPTGIYIDRISPNDQNGISTGATQWGAFPRKYKFTLPPGQYSARMYYHGMPAGHCAVVNAALESKHIEFTVKDVPH